MQHFMQVLDLSLSLPRLNSAIQGRDSMYPCWNSKLVMQTKKNKRMKHIEQLSLTGDKATFLLIIAIYKAAFSVLLCGVIIAWWGTSVSKVQTARNWVWMNDNKANTRWSSWSKGIPRSQYLRTALLTSQWKDWIESVHSLWEFVQK